MSRTVTSDTHLILFPEQNGPIFMDKAAIDTKMAIPYGSIFEVSKLNDVDGKLIVNLGKKITVLFKISDHLCDFMERNNGKTFIGGQEVKNE
jgi:hypothetical protein